MGGYMSEHPELIVMLTYNDQTVLNAPDIFEECRNSKASIWGFKELPLPFGEMKKLYNYMKQCGKTTSLEVVAYTEEEGLAGAETAAACGCDILMGTVFSDRINRFCLEHGLKYMPFVGKVWGRPSVLEGDIDEMIAEAKSYISRGAYGIDLLGYRYTGDAVELNRRMSAEVNAPVCIAGSVNSFNRLDEIKEAGPWSFTIGSAFFDNKFSGTFAEQIDKVCDYMAR